MGTNWFAGSQLSATNARRPKCEHLPYLAGGLAASGCLLPFRLTEEKEKKMKDPKSLLAVTLAAMIIQGVHGQEPGKADQEAVRRDQLRAAVQEICPVSGNQLGAHCAESK